jgi:hypothetical protein
VEWREVGQEIWIQSRRLLYPDTSGEFILSKSDKVGRRSAPEPVRNPPAAAGRAESGVRPTSSAEEVIAILASLCLAKQVLGMEEAVFDNSVPRRVD